MEGELHVIFGSGQVGYPLAQMLLQGGRQVRIVKRSAGGTVRGAEVVLGDATDPAFCRHAARGAETVYHCMNPPYDARVWADLVPRFMDNLIQAAGGAGSRLVVLDNVYMLGRPEGRILSERTAVNPCSRKGEIRARAAERLFDAHRRGEVLATSGRASDFYGPRGTLTHLGDQFWKPALAGKTVWVVVDPDAVHTYHYLPDVARGLATLGCAASEDFGAPWMLPCPPAESMRQLALRISGHLGREIRLKQIPRSVVKGIGLFARFVRELDEMSYQWDEPFVIDDSRFRGRFGLQPTDVEVAAANTASWAKAHYAQG